MVFASISTANVVLKFLEGQKMGLKLCAGIHSYINIVLLTLMGVMEMIDDMKLEKMNNIQMMTGNTLRKKAYIFH